MTDFNFVGASECRSVGGSNPLAATIARMMMSDMPQLAVAQANDISVQAVTAGSIERGGFGIA